MDTDDQGYLSGKFKEDANPSDDGGEKNSPGMAGTPPKERSAMNMSFIEGQPVGKRGGSSKDAGGVRPTPQAKLGLADTPSADTPTSNLAGQLKSISFLGRPPSGLVDSPTSDYVSGNFPSLCESDRGYASMPSMDKPEEPTTSVNPPSEQVAMATDDKGGVATEEMEVDDDGTLPKPKDSSKIGIAEASSFVPGSAAKSPEWAPSETSSVGSHESGSSLSSAPLSLLPSRQGVSGGDSPSVPSVVAEDVEIMTEGVPPAASSSSSSSSSLEQRRLDGRQEGVTSKRSFPDSDLVPSTKNPRLSPEASGKRCYIRSRPC